MLKTFSRYFVVVILACGLIILAFVSIGLIEAAPEQQDVNDTPLTVNILSGSGITSDTSGTAVVAINYGIGDCFANVKGLTETAINTATFIVQHAVVSGEWITGTTFAGIGSNTTLFLTAPLYGRWTRGYVYLANSTYPITLSLNCVLKNRAN